MSHPATLCPKSFGAAMQIDERKYIYGSMEVSNKRVWITLNPLYLLPLLFPPRSSSWWLFTYNVSTLTSAMDSKHPHPAKWSRSMHVLLWLRIFPSYLTLYQTWYPKVHGQLLTLTRRKKSARYFAVQMFAHVQGRKDALRMGSPHWSSEFWWTLFNAQSSR